MIRVLIQAGEAPADRAAVVDLSRYLAARERVSVDISSAGSPHPGADVVVALGDLDDGAASDLGEYVARGGGLILFAGGDPGPVAKLLGISEGAARPARETELILRVTAPDHPITRRIDPEFPVVAAATLIDRTPADATALIETSWRYERRPIAYTRSIGAGRIVAFGLAPTPRVLATAPILRLIHRSVRHLAGAESTSRTAVAMIGFGAIGREHADAVGAVPGLDLTVICDRNSERQAAARELYPAVRTVPGLPDVLEDAAVDLAIVSTPPNTHADVAAQLLRAGKHVVVEKPFCLTASEADELIELAGDRRRVLTVYQNRRWDPDFLAIRRAIARGEIGDVFHLESFVGGFGHPCDYWHSHEPISGGVFFDWGSHYLDWILNLVPDRVEAVWASAHKRVWHDVTNADQARIGVRFVGGAEAEFIHSDIAAALKPKWYILGTRGAIVADWRFESVKSRHWTGDLIEEDLAAAEAPPIVRIHTREGDGRIHVQTLGLPATPAFPFHRNLADHLHDGEPLAVPPESARRNVAVLAAAKYSADHGSVVVPVDA